MRSESFWQTSRELGAPFDPELVLRIRPSRHVGRWVTAAVALVLVGFGVKAFVTSPNVGGRIIGHYLFSHPILSGVLVTMEVALCAEVLAIILGITFATCRLSKNPVLKTIAIFYVVVVRSIPPLVLLILIYNVGFLFPQLSIGVPFTALAVSTKTNHLVTGFSAAIVGLGLSDGAYMAEIFRAGILGVDPGQIDAARAIGASHWLTMRKIVFPRAMRLIIPPAGNNFIGLLKATSLISVISGLDLLTQTEVIYSRTFQVIPLLLVATIWYLALVGLASLGQQQLERKFNRDQRPHVGTQGIDL